MVREILKELRRTLAKFGRSQTQIDRRIDAMMRAFPDALVEGFEDLIPSMFNDAKDRHVLAAAVKCGANVIVTDNARHFPQEALAPYDLECLTADQFLERQYLLDPDAFINVLREQAACVSFTLPHLISLHVPSLSRLIKFNSAS